MKIIKNILRGYFIFLCIAALILIFFPPEGVDISTSIPMFIFFAIIVFFLFKPTKKEKREKANNTNTYQENSKKANKINKRQEKLKTCTMKHINGLPIAENKFCQITCTVDKFIFTSESMNFELEKTKITDISIKTDREIQQQYVSSVGGAVGGAVLLGPLGAIIGGRAKKKTVKKEIHSYLIITYQSPEVKYIGFEIGNSIADMASVQYYIDDFKNNHSSESTYQL